MNSYLLCRRLSFDYRQEIDKQKSEGPINGIKESICFRQFFRHYLSRDSDGVLPFTENGRK